MYYIYTLSYNKIPFYAGMTNNPVWRYRGHFYYSDGMTYNFVRYNLIEFNRCPTIELISCANNKDEALKIERNTILALANAGFFLLNKDYNYRNADKQDIPIYPHFSKLPKKWFSDLMMIEITNKQSIILKEYEQQ